MLKLEQWRRALVVAAALAVAACGGSNDDNAGGSNSDNVAAGPTVEVRGVTEPVEIVRDRYGVAHIYAKN